MKIKILDDPSCEMMEIYKDDDCIFCGNYWDFDYSPIGIKDFLKELGLNVTRKKYKY